MIATAEAHPNIALVKYWGKRDAELNLPAAGSLSLTLAPMRTRTTVRWGAERDALWLDDAPVLGRPLHRISRFLDLIRADAPELGHAEVRSDNDFPTAAGVASSASAFAALALAATAAAGRRPDDRTLSTLARRGSGSAARSVFGGWVRMHAADTHNEAFAEPLFASPLDWDVRVCMALTTTGAKDVPSTDGMDLTAATSPYYDAWLGTVPPAIDAATQAIAARDIEALAQVAEASALQMHASAIAATPGVLYWNGTTVALIHAVRRWRSEGLPCFFTIDAGPHVKVFAEAGAAEQVAARLRDVPGVTGVLEATAGGPARLVETA